MIGYWEKRVVDKKWRIRLPIQIKEKVGESVFLSLNKEGIVIITDKATEKYPFTFEVAIEKNGRITIPSVLRNTTSFFFKKVDLAGFGDRLEVWPCP